MSQSTDLSTFLKPPSSFYFGHFRGTLQIYHCTRTATLQQLTAHVREWLHAELGPEPKIFRKISMSGKPLINTSKDEQMDARMKRATQPIPRSYYLNTRKSAALNLQGYAVAIAEEIIGGGDERKYPLLAIVDGPGKEYVLVLPTMLKRRPESLKLEPAGTQSQSEEAFVNWPQCLRSLQDAGLVRAEAHATRGSEERREITSDTLKDHKPGMLNHELRGVFLGLHEDLLIAAQKHWDSLSMSADDGQDMKVAKEEKD